MSTYSSNYNKPYSQTGWQNLPNETTPITAEILNENDRVIEQIDNFLNGTEAFAQENKIEKIVVNGTEATITDKTVSITTGGEGGTSDYTQLSNKPSINNVTLNGNKSLADLGITQTDNNYTNADKSKLAGIEANANNYSLPKATTSTLGGVKVDGTTVTVSEDGTISAIQETKPTVALIPPMTSNTEPYGTVSSSGATSSSFIDWQAFDGQIGSAYYAEHWWNTNNGYIEYTFDKKVSLKKVSLYGYGDYTKTNKVELLYTSDGEVYSSIGVFDYTEELTPSTQTMIEFNLIENVKSLRLKSVTTELRIGCIQAYGYVEDSIFDDDITSTDKGWTSAKIAGELSSINTNLDTRAYRLDLGDVTTSKPLIFDCSGGIRGVIVSVGTSQNRNGIYGIYASSNGIPSIYPMTPAESLTVSVSGNRVTIASTTTAHLGLFTYSGNPSNRITIIQ